MFMLVQHRISDPERFWRGAEEFVASQPKDVKLHASYPNEDGTRATCLWEAGSVEAVQDPLDRFTAGISRNEYIAIDPARAIGLPPSALGAQRPGARL